MNTEQPRGRKAVVLLAVVIALVALLTWRLQRKSPGELLDAAATALEHGTPVEAELIARDLLLEDPRSVDAALLAARACVETDRPEDALRYLRDFGSESSEATAEACWLEGRILLFELNRLSDAEHSFRRALDLQPHHEMANFHLAGLLGMCGRRWEASSYRLRLIQQGRLDVAHLLALGMGERSTENTELIAGADDTITDPLIAMAEANSAIRRGDDVQALELLRLALELEPRLIEAYAKTGRLLIDSNRIDEIRRWHERLPAGANHHPEIWTIRGDWLADRAEMRHAVRCYVEALRINPNDRRSNFELSKSLRSIGRRSLADAFASRAARLDDYFTALKRVLATGDPQDMRRVVAITEDLGLDWEAWAWAQLLAESERSENSQAAVAAPRFGSRPRSGSRTNGGAALLNAIDLESLPSLKSCLSRFADDGSRPDEVNAPIAFNAIQFFDAASQVELDFTYDDGRDSTVDGLRFIDFTGGGAAVLDFDRDEWPDVYLSQGAASPSASHGAENSDVLFRNLAATRFLEVAQPARLKEDHYSQGVAVGDYDNDGFPDIYVANVGANRLFRNNGDGTFSDVTEFTDSGGDQWTTSCLLADVTGDGLPDLYAVNYLSGDGVVDRICRHSDGFPKLCSPYEFSAAQDQLYVNLGDGEFRCATSDSGIENTHGKGLGILAGDFDGSGRLSLFVANDTEANCYFIRESPPEATSPVFRDAALVAGLAYDWTGRSQACMGVASGDVDGNGRLDLFVTNYEHESNALYLSHADGFFTDESRQSGLREPSIPMLGFGAQFLDADLDGWLDLILTNGHVDDLRRVGSPFRMRPQFFRNTGDAKFAELDAEQLGPFFSGTYLGRGLARLDWNRDGKPDALISHLDSPTALLTNDTDPCGGYLVVRLIGIHSPRDAIGTTVTANVDGRRLVRQLTAGDGYQASNQRQIVFGLGGADRVAEIRVEWPSGGRQAFQDLPAGREFALREQDAVPHEIVRSPQQPATFDGPVSDDADRR